ncbi:ParB N-terminal domain-containing protein [Azohydromonas sp.]|uniref:ParB N-terminal domain-containing protein n=1 Tax=Azohydromonas sp. TaxID=1872666 RepID=UPI002BDA3857|nr:ParB N-terminal domain-containing protein [Azohydromonas sp.]HMM83912.1 ParB N-terminal domain-containing protein [Azohydromonas sp.]
MSADLHRHPLSAAFGDMPKDEFDELVADIKKNGLISPVVYLRDEHDTKLVLDGWHRYRACIEAGVEPRLEPFNFVTESADEQSGRKMSPAEFVVAANAHRRHLSREQRRQVVVELLKAKPEASDRAIAAQAKVDHKTVGAVRREAEATGEIPQLGKTTGKDGKTRVKPARAKYKPKPMSPRAIAVARQADSSPPRRDRWQAFMVDRCGWVPRDPWVLGKACQVDGIALIASSRGDNYVFITAREAGYDPVAKLPEAIFEVTAHVEFAHSTPEHIAHIEQCIVDAAAALLRTARPVKAAA